MILLSLNHSHLQLVLGMEESLDCPPEFVTSWEFLRSHQYLYGSLWMVPLNLVFGAYCNIEHIIVAKIYHTFVNTFSANSSSFVPVRKQTFIDINIFMKYKSQMTIICWKECSCIYFLFSFFYSAPGNKFHLRERCNHKYSKNETYALVSVSHKQ